MQEYEFKFLDGYDLFYFSLIFIGGVITNSIFGMVIGLIGMLATMKEQDK